MAGDSAVVLVSGGLNSMVAAVGAAKERAVNLLFVDYGQPAAGREWAAVQRISKSIGAASLLRVETPQVVQIAKSTRDEEPGDTGPMPGLLAMFLCAAYQWAVRLHARRIVTGVSQLADEIERGASPGQGRPDHRREFLHAFDVMLEELQAARKAIRIETPLIGLARSEIVKLGRRFGAPLDMPWCCHLGGEIPCGDCPGCTARADAYREAGEPDPVAPSAL